MIKNIISIGILLGMFFAAFQFIDRRYSLAEDTKAKIEILQKQNDATNRKVDYNFAGQVRDYLERRINEIKKEYTNRKMDKITQETLLDLEQRKAEKEKEMKALEQVK